MNCLDSSHNEQNELVGAGLALFSPIGVEKLLFSIWMNLKTTVTTRYKILFIISNA